MSDETKPITEEENLAATALANILQALASIQDEQQERLALLEKPRIQAELRNNTELDLVIDVERPGRQKTLTLVPGASHSFDSSAPETFIFEIRERGKP